MPLFPRPSLHTPDSIKPFLFFTSAAFVASATQDIDDLLNAFEAAWALQALLSPSWSVKGFQRDGKGVEPQINGATRHNGKRKRSDEDGDIEDGALLVLTEGERSTPTITGVEGGQEEEAMLSPFQVFKNVYADKGWTHIHLAVVDPALRAHWFETLTRLLLERLRRDGRALQQIAALFALYVLHGSQPPQLGPQYNLKVALPLYQYILSMPHDMAPVLDDPRHSTFHFSQHLPPPAQANAAEAQPAAGFRNGGNDIEIDPLLLETNVAPVGAAPDNAPSAASSPLTPTTPLSLSSPEPEAYKAARKGLRPSSDLLYVVNSLCSSGAWSLVPSALFSYPRLPTSRLGMVSGCASSAAKREGPNKVNGNSLAVPDEDGNRDTGAGIPASAGASNKADAAAEMVAMREELARWATGQFWPGVTPHPLDVDLSAAQLAEKGGWEPPELLAARSSYVDSKRALDPRTFQPTVVEVDDGSVEKAGAAMVFEKELMTTAVNMTMNVMKPATGPLLLEALLPPGESLATGGDGATAGEGLSVFRMVSGPGPNGYGSLGPDWDYAVRRLSKLSKEVGQGGSDVMAEVDHLMEGA